MSASSSCHGAAPQQGRLPGERMGMMLSLIPIPEEWEETSHPVTTLITPRSCTGLCLTPVCSEGSTAPPANLLPCLLSFPAHQQHGSCRSAPRRELGTAKMETGWIKMDGTSLSFPSTFPEPVPFLPPGSGTGSSWSSSAPNPAFPPPLPGRAPSPSQRRIQGRIH